jgi:hypothetical protein
MDTALVVACISGVVALGSAVIARSTQLQVMKLQREGRAEDRRSEAKVILDSYRGPLLDAAWQLGDRVDNIRNKGFFAYLSESSGRVQEAKLSTLFRLANYLGWREFVRIKVQLLPFEDEKDTRSAHHLSFADTPHFTATTTGFRSLEGGVVCPPGRCRAKMSWPAPISTAATWDPM